MTRLLVWDSPRDGHLEFDWSEIGQLTGDELAAECRERSISASEMATEIADGLRCVGLDLDPEDEADMAADLEHRLQGTPAV